MRVILDVTKRSEMRRGIAADESAVKFGRRTRNTSRVEARHESQTFRDGTCLALTEILFSCLAQIDRDRANCTNVI